MPRIWAGVDAGKTHHHCVVIDADGTRLLSRRVGNDEPELLQLLADVLDLGEEVTWAVDLADGGAALLIGVLLNHDQFLLYIPGRTVHRAAGGYRGEGKTDAKDAAIIADQARMRRDLQPMRSSDRISAELKLLTGHRADLVADRTRTVNRLRGLLNGIFPALERELELTNNGPLVLLSGYQTPTSIRRIGSKRHHRPVRTARSQQGLPAIRVRFFPSDCGDCPALRDCVSSPTAKRRELTLRPREDHHAAHAARALQQTDAWKDRYKIRNGVEGTISQGVQGYGMRRTRYRGLRKTRLDHRLTATAINLTRIDAWLAGTPHAHTRVPHHVKALRPAVHTHGGTERSDPNWPAASPLGLPGPHTSPVEAGALVGRFEIDRIAALGFAAEVRTTPRVGRPLSSARPERRRP